MTGCSEVSAMSPGRPLSRRQITYCERRYRRQLGALRAGDSPQSRAARLEQMAGDAETLSASGHSAADAGCCRDTAAVLRALAAAERGYVLTDPQGATPVMDPANHYEWMLLASHAQDPASRDEDIRGIYQALREASAALLPGGTTVVLGEIADRARGDHEPGKRARAAVLTMAVHAVGALPRVLAMGFRDLPVLGKTGSARSRYRRQIRALEYDAWPASRAARLDQMAICADTIAASVSVPGGIVGYWGKAAAYLRAIAASERGYILTSPLGDDPVLDPANHENWVLASSAQDRGARYQALCRIYEAASGKAPWLVTFPAKHRVPVLAVRHDVPVTDPAQLLADVAWTEFEACVRAETAARRARNRTGTGGGAAA